MEEIINKLKQNYIYDLNKKEIDKFERAAIIQDIMKSEKLSIRAFAEKFGFAKSTVEDWLLWTKISRDEFNQKLKEGETESEIYRLLRNNKTKIVSEFVDIDFVLEKTIHKLNQEREVSKYTKEKVERLEKALNRFKLKNNL